MKKTLAILLALALVFSTITVSFAEEAISGDAKIAKDLGMLVGDQSGVTADYLKTAPQRIQAAIMILRLKGLEDEAKAFTGTDNFADADKAAWAKPIMAYLKANPSVGFAGVGNNEFNPTGLIDAKSYYKVMLETLGYAQGTDFTWDNLITFAGEKNLKAVANTTSFTVNDVAVATVETLKANVKGAEKTLVAKLIADKVITEQAAIDTGLVSGELAVSSVTANAAKSFLVKFNKAVADTTKATFTVKRGLSTVALTTTWNADKTEATLASSSKFVTGDYEVKVTVDAKDLATKTIKIEAEKVAEIKFLSDTVVRANDYEGYITYKVTNQYGEDITNAPLGSGIEWKSSVQVIEAVRNTNKLRLVQGNLASPNLTDLRYQPSVVVTAFDNASRTFTSQTFKVSDRVAGVSEITINGIVDKDGKPVDLVAASVQKFYLSYDAVDAFGNKVNDYNTLNNQNIFRIYSSNDSIAKVTVVRDAVNNTKALLEVTAGPASTVTFDMPVVFTAVAYTSGKSSNYTTTVKKAAVVTTFSIYSPSTEVAVGETHAIPYSAFDQNGNEVTAYEQLVGKINMTYNGGAVVPTRAANGKAEFKVTFNTPGPQYVTASVVNTANLTTASVYVRDAAVPKSLVAIAADDFKPAMVMGATQVLKTSDSTIVVNDQFDRKININIDNTYGAPAVPYTVTAVSDNPGAIAVTGTGELGNAITLTAGSTFGPATITFELRQNSVIIDTTSIRVSNVEKKDIIAYQVEPIDTLWANARTATNEALLTYVETPEAVGTLVGGAKVALASSDVITWSVTANDVIAMEPDFDLYALNNGSNMTAINETTAQVTAIILAANNATVTATGTVKATKTAPVVTVMGVSAAQADRRAGIAEISGDTIKIDAAALNADVAGLESIFYYDNNGDVKTKATFYVTVEDNYNDAHAQTPAYVTLVKQSGTGTLSVTNGTGVLTGRADFGDRYLLTVVAHNGMTVTKIIEVK